MKNIKTLLIISVLNLYLLSCASEFSFIKYDLIKKTSNLSLITPVLKTNLNKKINLLYCASFHLAWNTLKNNIVSEAVKLNGGPDYVKFLNDEEPQNKVVNKTSYLAAAGMIKDGILKIINTGLQKKFGFTDKSLNKTKYNAEDIIIYSYMKKGIRFKYKFEQNKDSLFFHSSNKKLASFGFDKLNEKSAAGISKQLTIHDFKNKNDFIVRLLSSQKNDEIILAKIKPEKSLYKTFVKVIDRIKHGKKNTLKPGDSLQIPVINFLFNHSFQELVNKKLINKKFNDYQISRAQQVIRFSLNECGADIASKAQIDLEITSKDYEPADYSFNKPFLLMLRRSGKKYPYLVIWFANASLFLPAN